MRPVDLASVSGSVGQLVILSGPSGVGKDTVIEAWRKVNPRVERVVAFTTRPPRPGESNGVDYHFVSEERFMAMAQAGEFLEHKEVHGRRYATPRAGVDRLLGAGKIAILKIDVQGALAVMDLLPETVSIFLLPPSPEELERRIRGRGSESPADVQRRLDAAREETAQAHRYRYQVVNVEPRQVVGELENILAADLPEPSV